MVVFLSNADHQPFHERIFHAVRFDIDTWPSQASFATTTRHPHGDRDSATDATASRLIAGLSSTAGPGLASWCQPPPWRTAKQRSRQCNWG